MLFSEEMQGRLLAAPVSVHSIEEKILSGEYSFEEAPCVCGSSEEIELSRVDRDQLPHRLVICKDCALIRANPRLTAVSQLSYYNAEYRDLNVGRLLVPDHTAKRYLAVDDPDTGFKAQYDSGLSTLQWLDECDLPTPRNVIEIGSRWGGLLAAFKNAGSRVVGVEANNHFCTNGKNQPCWVYKSIDALIEGGAQPADLIVMQESLDHFTDLRELTKIKSLLKPDGLLYIQTPGFFSKDPNKLTRLGRNYHFCQNTLSYTLSQFDFEEVYVDEEVRSLWRHRGYEALVVFPRKPTEWIEYSLDYLFKKDDEPRKIPPFPGQCKYSKKLLHSNMRENLSHGIPDIEAISGKKSGSLIIVAGGPSVSGQLPYIEALKRSGIPVLAISRMYPWLLERGVVPDYCLTLDCHEEQEKGFDRLDPHTTFLIASSTNTKIVKKLAGYNSYIFDTQDNRKYKQIRVSKGYTVATVINAGGSVAINAISVAMNLGYSELEVFGLDLMVQKKEQTHVEGISGKSVEFDFITVTVNGEDILTTPSFLDFAGQTLDIISAGHDAGYLKSVTFWGESLINKMWDGEWHEEEGTDALPNA